MLKLVTNDLDDNIKKNEEKKKQAAEDRKKRNEDVKRKYRLEK